MKYNISLERILYINSNRMFCSDEYFGKAVSVIFHRWAHPSFTGFKVIEKYGKHAFSSHESILSVNQLIRHQTNTLVVVFA